LREYGSQEKRRRRRAYVNCECVCGTVAEVAFIELESGHSRSCGCLLIDTLTTHGLSKTLTYKSWLAMKTRCTNPTLQETKEYCEQIEENYWATLGEQK